MRYAYKLNTVLKQDIANQNEIILTPALFRAASPLRVQLSNQGRIWLALWLAIGDALLITASFMLAGGLSAAMLAGSLALYGIITLAAHAVKRTPVHNPLWSSRDTLTLSGFGLGLASVSIAAPVAENALIAWVMLALAGMVFYRFALRSALPRLSLFDSWIERIIFIGAREDLKHFVHQTTRQPFLPFKFMGYFVLDKAEATPEEDAYLGSLDEEEYILLDGDIDRVILISRQADNARIEQTLRKIDGLNVRVDLCLLPLLGLEVFAGKASLASLFQNCHLVTLRQPSFTGVPGVMKRLFDIIASGAALLALSPLLGVIAVAVAYSSPGGVFFRQERWGLNGKPFYILKFRSMYKQPDDGTVRQATQDDARVTRIGAFLRSTSLDELPQLINVLLGDMSLIGPRPHAVPHNRYYAPLVSGYLKRFRALPGLSGLAQVHGYRGETRTLDLMQKRIEYDIAYLRDWSFWLDMMIIIRTLGLVASRRNAY